MRVCGVKELTGVRVCGVRELTCERVCCPGRVPLEAPLGPEGKSGICSLYKVTYINIEVNRSIHEQIYECSNIA